MFSFEDYVNLSLVWGGLVAVAVFLYVCLDGFDLGVGILFPFAPSEACRNKIMNSIAPFWDGNETWLVLGGGGLFVAFPVAYGIIMSALYTPIILMLLCLIFRGVAFEFRFKADSSRWMWDTAFHFGSLGAAFFQGVILGGFIQGMEVEGRVFAGGPADWLTGFSMLVGLSMVFGYALIGACWLIMKTDDITQKWARIAARYNLIFVGLFMAAVSLFISLMHPRIASIWFSFPNFFLLLPIPIITAALVVMVWRDIGNKREYRPFFLSLGLFVMGYIGLAISLWPWVVPFAFTLEEAAARPESLSLLLVGALIMLPVVLGYTAYCYWVFRGKTDDRAMY